MILVWIAINGIMLATRAFDPFPFILLNLVLSCLAAVQAPVIMMSQNRSEARDRLRAENDYKVNLKADSKFGICTRNSIISCAVSITGYLRFSRFR